MESPLLYLILFKCNRSSITLPDSLFVMALQFKFNCKKNQALKFSTLPRFLSPQNTMKPSSKNLTKTLNLDASINPPHFRQQTFSVCPNPVETKLGLLRTFGRETQTLSE